MSILQTKQIWFAKHFPLLLLHFDELDITLGEAWRSPETCALYAKEGKGVPYSCHQMRLAIDINIIINGELSYNKSDYQPLADFWKKLPLGFPCDIPIVTAWGGDFTSLADPYHFSVEHLGIR